MYYIHDIPTRPEDRDTPFDMYRINSPYGFGRILFGYDAELDQWMRLVSVDGLPFNFTFLNVKCGLDLANGTYAWLHREELRRNRTRVSLVLVGIGVE